jgi:MYXO-CTERM domain-containing protein
MEIRLMLRAPRLLLCLPLLLSSCVADQEGGLDPLIGEVESSGFATTCSPHLEYYPIGGPHNGGYDSNALNYTCPDHPSNSPDNSDFIAGDHYGNDLFAARYTPAVAVVSGTISHSGYGSVSGNRVTIVDSCGWHYFSGHLDSIAPGMSVGTYVSAGTQIGTVGNTGNATGTSPHIHFSIYPEDYEAGIDPFPYLQGVDAGSCDGEGSYSAGPIGPDGEPDPGWNPCVDSDITSSTRDSSFALISGAASALTEIGGSTGEFLTAPPYSNFVELAVGKWAPWISHTGEWSLEAFVPETATSLATSAIFDIAFHGGHALKVVDLEASKGSWVPLFDQGFKFVAGPRGYVSLTNLAPADGGWLAYDSVRWVFIGPTGSGALGASCDMSTDCSGTYICGESGTCESDCSLAGCDAGECDMATGVCVEPDVIDPMDPWGDEYTDADGDGIPNYLEGFEDSDGDGLPNYTDYDADNDGIPDSVEGSADMDGDGLMDFLDDDSDGDGILDADEVGDDPDFPLDSDLDGIPDFRDSDSDNDGIPDSVEVGHPDEPWDTDGDGTPDYLDDDSDNDGISDGDEAGMEPSSPADTDHDGTPDYLQRGEGSVEDGVGGLVLPDGNNGLESGCACSSSGGGSALWGLLLLPLVVRRRR